MSANQNLLIKMRKRMGKKDNCPFLFWRGGVCCLLILVGGMKQICQLIISLLGVVHRLV